MKTIHQKGAGRILTAALILACAFASVGCGSAPAGGSNSASGGSSGTGGGEILPLKTVYADDFLIGNIVNNRYLSGDYFELLTTHYNIVTPENDLKPDNLAPRAKGGAYTWDTADRIVNTMQNAGIPVFGHTLIWHSQTPAWMTTGTREEVEANLKTHITTVLNHYKGKVMAWDVVNEAIRDGLSSADNWKNCLRTDSGWYRALGADYIELAFRTARETDPGLTLYYNDYGMDSSGKSTAARNMIKDINDRYLAEGNTRKLIEGIGMQSHYQSSSLSAANVRRSLDRFIEIGLEVAVSELDIRFGSMVTGTGNDSKMTDADAATQARLYAQLFTLYREYRDHIPRVTMWGMDDYFSWLSRGNPCLFDANLEPKKAFYAVADPGSY